MFVRLQGLDKMGVKRLIGRILIMCVASIATTLSAASEQPASVNVDLVDNPVVVDMKLSPDGQHIGCLLYTSPSPRDATLSRMPSSA